MLLDLSPLKNKDLRHIFLGQLISSFGNQMSEITIPFQVYALTHSAFYTGLVSAVELVFLVITGFWGGVIADTREKRRILLGAEIGLALLTLGLAGNALCAQPSLVAIFALAAVSSALVGLHRPALESLMPRLVPKEDLAKVSALMPLRNILMVIVAPTLAGLCIAQFGAVFTYLLDALTFVASLYFISRLPKVYPLPQEEGQKPGKPWQAVWDGWRYVCSRQELIGTYLIDFMAMVFCMPHALFPAIAEAYNKKEWVGLLYAAPSLGGLAVTLFSRWTLGIRRQGLFIILAASFWSLSISTVGLASHFSLVLAGLSCAGAFDMVSGIFRTTLWNQTIPASFRGRLASFEMISYMSGPLLGNAVAGFMADALGVQQALLWGGITSVVFILLATWKLPLFWHYRSPTQP